MRVAILSDIHGNLEALLAVEQAMSKNAVDKIVSLGDVIGYGADPHACLKWVRENCTIAVLGNHEDAVLDDSYLPDMNIEAAKIIHWTKKQLTAIDLQMIASWPLQYSFQQACFVHGSPHHPEKFAYLIDSFYGRLAFEAFSDQLCFFGHTHCRACGTTRDGESVRWLQIEDEIKLERDWRYLINVGSVGQPRNNDPHAQWGLWDTVEQKMFFHKVDYDIEKAQKKILTADLPRHVAERLSIGR